MKEIIACILQFGNLNTQQIDLIRSKAREIEVVKDHYFAEDEKVLKQLRITIDGIIRTCFTTTKVNKSPRFY